MCGVVGVFSSTPVDPDRMTRALRSLRNRGPDGEGVWWTEDRQVGLGHRRLAINGTDNSAQPLIGDRFVTSLNGEFYDLPESYRNRTDSLALPDALERHPVEQALSSLTGEFAGLVYDRLERRLLAVRDRFGVKPLYWGYRQEELWLASKPSALWAAGVKPGWCERGFAQAGATQYPLPGRTIFAGVSSLKPGHYLQIEGAKLREKVYWRVPMPSPESRPVDLGEELEKAVLRRLRRGHKNAVLLSGGIDSAAVAALAARSEEEVTAYTVDFTEPTHRDFSESSQAVAQSSLCGLPHRILKLTANELLEDLPQAVKALEGIVVNGHAVAKWRLSRAIREDGCKVVLSGEGADELLYGYSHFAPYFVKKVTPPVGPVDRDAHAQRACAVKPPVGPVGLGILTTRASAAPLPDDWPIFFHTKYYLGRKIAAFLSLPLHPLSAFKSILNTLEPATSRETARQAWLQTALTSYILETLSDGAEMAHSVEGRPPFLDHKLWERVAATPIRDGNKTLLRHAMSDLVVPEIVTKPKHPFMAGPLGEPLLREAERVISDSRHPFVSRKRSQKILRRLRQARAQERLEWEPALVWLLSSYYLQELWT